VIARVVGDMVLNKNFGQGDISGARLGKFLTLAGVLLRSHTRTVLGKLVATSAADLLPTLEASGFLSMVDDDKSQLSLQVNGVLLSDERAEKLKTQLLARLDILGQNFEYNSGYQDEEGRPFIWELPGELQRHLRSKTLYFVQSRTPTQHYGWLVGGVNQPLDRDSLKFFEALASISAISLENATRLEDMQENAAETALLNQIAGEMASSLNPEELFQTFLGRLHDIFSFEWAGLFLLSGVNNYDLIYNWNSSPGRVRRRLTNEKSLSGSLLEEAIKDRVILVDPPEIGGEESAVFPSEISARLVIPLLNRGHTYGALALGSLEAGHFLPHNLPLLLLEKLSIVFTPAFINSRRYEEKQYLAEIDERVGTFNHNYFERELPLQVEKARRLNYKLGLLIVDMDNLKFINDTYNYQIGSASLKHIAEIIQHCVRRTDLVARYGGDEFTVLLPGCSEEGLEIVSENIRRTINETGLTLSNGEKLKLAVSVGAALLPNDAVEPDELFERANAALQVAKQGRNQVRIGTDAHPIRLDEEVLRRGEPERILSGIPETTTSGNSGRSSSLDSSLSLEDFERFINWLGTDKHGVSAQLMSELYQQLRESNQSINDLNERVGQMERGFRRSLLLSSAAIEQRELYMSGAAEKTSQLAIELAERANCTLEDVWAIKSAALLANLGRLTVKEAVWTKRKPLSQRDWVAIRKVPVAGARLSEALGGILTHNAQAAIRFQRERFDGTGYPAGLAGDEIPFLARILGICTAVAAMGQRRPHRPALTPEQIKVEIEQGAGRQFDPQLARLMLDILDK